MEEAEPSGLQSEPGISPSTRHWPLHRLQIDDTLASTGDSDPSVCRGRRVKLGGAHEFLLQSVVPRACSPELDARLQIRAERLADTKVLAR